MVIAPQEQEHDVQVEVDAPGTIISMPFIPFAGNCTMLAERKSIVDMLLNFMVVLLF